ncbi:MAG: rod shape-determining protein RodA [Chloroflexi bacterium]|uniref:Rod shape-determining protein RodA n=1 Tax=Candidatus Chlorohelix allophototropha TaxID=3003348 RepID=A0A8T7M2P2_9CHLR|nr:rod shape-determining protein RodA [Chloroflexota bacterium]WJW65722.1 rod shape-determining protein RodA [Chloroflexota bacterium L227-S17]
MEKSIWRFFDIPLLIGVLITALFGVLMVYSATHTDPALSPLNMHIKQLTVGVGLGMILLFLMARMDYHFFEYVTFIVYILCVGLLFLVRVIGQTTSGSTRWIDLGFTDIQPSEPAKLLMVIVLARFYATNEHRIQRFPVFATSLLVAAPAVILVFIQPDLGTTMVLIAIWFGMAWAGGTNLVHLFGLIFIAVPIVLLIWFAPDLTGGKVQIFSDYQYERFHSFWDPNYSDPSQRRNLEVSNKAVVGGGLLGQGYASGVQNTMNYLSIRHTDFIFSVIAEEFGFVGSIALLVLLALILTRILHIAQKSNDSYGRMICAGVFTMLFFQVFINVGMNLGLFPVTGIPLPLISNGNSAMWTMFISLGIVESVSMRHQRDTTWYYRSGAIAD